MTKKKGKAPGTPVGALPGGLAPGTIDATPPELADAIQSKRCALFVGAGLSIAAGFPGWGKLLEILIVRCEAKRQITAAHAIELRALIQESDKLLMVAQELADRFTRPDFVDEIVKVFADPRITPTPAHDEIVGIPFRFIVTTNYDKLLEQAFAKRGLLPPVYTHKNAGDFADALWRESFFVLKAHGHVDARSDMVITERDYREIVFRSPGYRAALSAIFTTKTVLFLGVSLTDPETKLLLSYLHDSFHGSATTHYALVRCDEFTETMSSRWAKDYKVHCVRYHPTVGHPEVLQFLRSLPHLP